MSARKKYAHLTRSRWVECVFGLSAALVLAEHSSDARGIVRAVPFANRMYVQGVGFERWDTSFPPYNTILPEFLGTPPLDYPLEWPKAQLDQPQVEWSPEGGLSGSDAAAGSGYTYDYYRTYDLYSPFAGAMAFGSAHQYAESYAFMQTRYDVGYVEGLEAVAPPDNQIRVVDFNLPFSGFVAPGGSVTIRADSQLGYGSFGAQWVYDEQEIMTITTPGPFEVMLEFPDAPPIATPPVNGTFYVSSLLRMTAYSGDDGITPTYVSNSRIYGGTLGVDTTGLEAEPLSGTRIDFGIRRIGTDSPTVPALQFYNGAYPDTVIHPDVGPFYGSEYAYVLKPTEEVDVGYSFEPDERGLTEETFLLPNSNVPFTLAGTGSGPEVGVETATPTLMYYDLPVLDFGNVEVGTVVQRTFVVSNQSLDPNNADSTITDLTFGVDDPGTAYQGDPDGDYEPIESSYQTTNYTNPLVLHQGESVTLILQFDATTAPLGQQFAEIEIFTDEGEEFGDLDGSEYEIFIFANVVEAGSCGTPGDYDCSGLVDGLDNRLWERTFGSLTDLRADGNRDGVVNAADYTVWRDQVGHGAAGASMHVPEPASMALVAVIVLSSIAWRNRFHATIHEI